MEREQEQIQMEPRPALAGHAELALQQQVLFDARITLSEQPERPPVRAVLRIALPVQIFLLGLAQSGMFGGTAPAVVLTLCLSLCVCK